MKGVVVEVRKHSSAILLEDGSVICRRRVYPVGKKIELADTGHQFSFMRMAAAMCTAAVLLLSFFAYRNYQYSVLAYSYISIRDGSSIEYTLNRYDDVIDVSANDEASAAAAAMLKEKVLNKSVEEAVTVYMEEVAGQEETVEIHVRSDDAQKTDELSDRISDSIDPQEHPHIITSKEMDEPDPGQQNRQSAPQEHDNVQPDRP